MVESDRNMILWRELTIEEVKKLLRKKRIRVWDPVTYRGLPAAKNTPGRRFKLRKVLERTVREEDANILMRSGWEIVEIYDPEDDDD